MLYLPSVTRVGSWPHTFRMYTADLPSVVAASGFSIRQYADDSQINGYCTTVSTVFSTFCPLWCRVARPASLTGCDLIGLRFNAHKADGMRCSSARRTSNLPSDPSNIAGIDVSPVSTVRTLGVLIDSELSAALHVRMVVSRRFAVLRQLRQLCRFVNDDCFRSLVWC